jgi:hypothetical protein
VTAALVVLACWGPAPPQVRALQAVLANDPLHAFAPDPYALAAQLEPDPRGRVGGGELVDTADLDDLLEQRDIVELGAAR